MAKDINLLSTKLDFFKAEENYVALSNFILNMMMMKNIDLSPLAGKLIQMLYIPYPPCKKVIYAYLSRHSKTISDLILLATNTLHKDFKDPNPLIRRLVINLASQVPSLHDLALDLLPQALVDPSPYVRCSAATATKLVINKDNVKDNQEVVDMLYASIRDVDPGVVCACLTSLDVILEADGGVVVSAKMMHYLVGRLPEFQHWNFYAVHSVLRKYAIKDHKELLLLMNALDSKLNDWNPAIFIPAADLALNFSEKLSKDIFIRDIFRLISPKLQMLLNQSFPEGLAAILEFVENHVPKYVCHFGSLYKFMFCRFCDPPGIKVKKLDLLYHFADEINCDCIADEMLSNCYDANKDVSSAAVRNFTQIIKKFPNLNHKIYPFINLIEVSYNGLNDEVLNALSTLDFGGAIDILSRLLSFVSNYAQNSNSVESKIVLLKFIGKYGTDITESPYILENLANDETFIEDEKCATLLLLTSVKLFVKRPAEVQLVLGQILQVLKKSPSVLLKKMSSIYYHLLKDEPSSLKLFCDESNIL